MELEKRIALFASLGKAIRRFLQGDDSKKKEYEILERAVEESNNHNPWFDFQSQHRALGAVADMLDEGALYAWLASYTPKLKQTDKQKKVALVLAGNIPLVGFHDWLCVLMSGNVAKVKLSSSDRFLLPGLAEIVAGYDESLIRLSTFTTATLKDFDAVIATGSDNTARYFRYYFSSYPHIIRKNRNGAAILHGKETLRDLELLGDDIFTYYGLGCRNVTRLYVPVDYDFTRLMDAWESFAHLKDHPRFFNNYEYHKAIYLINSEAHLDNGFVILKQDKRIESPVAVVHYDYYTDTNTLVDELNLVKDRLQCITGDPSVFSFCLAFGTAQSPGLHDYADGIDTMKFLLDLSQ